MVSKLLSKIVSIAEKQSDLILLVVRWVVGLVFLQTGWGKLNNLGQVTEYFTSLGIPFAQYQAPMAAATEFLGGLFLLVGLGVRWVSVPLTVIMCVAIKTAKWAEVEELNDFLGMSEFLYIVLFLTLFTRGAGRFSVDAWIRKRYL